MKTIWKTLITAGVASVIAFLVMVARNIFNVTAIHEIMKALCDGFFVSGILFVCFGLLVVASNGGTFDMIKYGVSSLFALFMKDLTKRKYRTFYDYRKAMQENQRSFGYLVVVGVVFVAISVVFLLLYLNFEPVEISAMLLN